MSNSQENPTKDTRERILLAAADEFLSYGYDNTKLDEIVKKAHVSKTAIYKFYGGKRELFIALAEYLNKDLLKLTLDQRDFRISSLDDLEKILRKIGHDYLTCALEKDNISKFRMALSMATRVEEVSKQYFYMGQIRLCEFIARYFKAAMEAKVIAYCDPEKAASHYVALLRADSHLRTVFDVDYQATEDDIKEAIDQAVKIFLYGYAPRN
ncbi:MAG: hypothetical protein DHS20C08_10050 [Rhodomicrobium sp.]|nr:MAG: hypothetical protein DHS20C08_10050 [Rhodomicrobium sp.]